MHVQVKTQIAPPEGVGGKASGWTIHDDFRAKPHGDGWLYEPIPQSPEGKIVFPIPGWLAMETLSVYVHDEEILKNGVGTILCSENGKPLSPYFIPRVQRKEFPNAFYSLPFGYARIVFDGRINYLHIEKIEPLIENVESSQYATVKRTILFSDTVKTVECFCKTCGISFAPEDIWDHMGHNVTPSTFDINEKSKIFDKAIRAVFKKALSPNQARPFFVYT